jgi:hypothetical protein
MAPVFAGRNRRESAVRWAFVIAFILAVVSPAAISIAHGSENQDRFEAAVLSVDCTKS